MTRKAGSAERARPAREVPVGVYLTIGYREEDNPSEARLREVLDQLPDLFPELPGASLTDDETEWSLGAFPDGRVVWMNLTEGGERHMAGVPRRKVLALWRLLTKGRIDAIEKEPWRPGPGV